MKINLIGIAMLCLSFCTHAQVAEAVVSGDSVIIRDVNITSDPFTLGNNPLAQLYSVAPKPTVQSEFYRNNLEQEKVDTAYTLRFGSDTFVIYTWGRHGNALTYADLRTPKFQTKHGLKVGLSDVDVIAALSNFNIPRITKYVVLENLGTSEYIRLDFHNQKVSRIQFFSFME